MWISDTSIKRPVFATMVILSFMVLGVVSMTRLGIDLFPDVNFPFVNVTVPYPGAAPEEVETLVTKPIEDAVAGINGVKRIESNSRESLARVGIELRLEVDPQQAAAEVREKVAAIRDKLPKEIEDPTIQRFDVAALPIMVFAVGSSQPSDVRAAHVEDDLKPLIEQIDGVAAVAVNGGEVREIQINLDPRRLEALELPVSVRSPTSWLPRTSTPGRQVEREGRSISLRTQGRVPRSRTRSRTSSCAPTAGSTVRLKDVGRSSTATRTRIDDAAQRRRRGVVLGPQAVGREHRRDRGARATPCWLGSLPNFPSSISGRFTTTRSSSRRTSRTCAATSSSAA